MSTLPTNPETSVALQLAQLALDIGRTLTGEQRILLNQYVPENSITVADQAVNKSTVETLTDTKFDKNKYNVSQTTYPKDLLSNPSYGRNYVIYYINEYDGISTNSAKSDTVSNVQMGINNSSGSKNSGVGDAVGTAVGTATVGGQILNGGVNAGNITKAIGKGGAAAVAAGSIAELAGVNVAGTTRKRLKMAIALPVPNDVAFSDSWNWSSEGGLGGAALDAASTQLSDLVGGDGSIEDKFKSIKSIGGSLGAGALTKIAASMPTQAAIIRQTVNEKQEVLFKGGEQRSFTHSFQFAATSREEIENIDRIIKALRYHSAHDFVDELSFIMVYPSDFDVHYYHGTQENKYIPKHTSCVLTNVSTNFSPNSVFATFDGGAPIIINLTLQFRELAIISKAEIKKGY